MLFGIVVGFWITLPILTAHAAQVGPIADWVGASFRHDVRFMGAGVIGVAAVWTLVKIAGPVAGGIRSSFTASRARGRSDAVALEERDLPFGIVAGGSLLVLVPIAALLWSTIAGGPLQPSAIPLIAGALLFVLVAGLVIAAVCGYMAALIGASNSPVSGIGILSVLAASLMLVGLFGRGTPAGTTQALVAYALIVTGIVFGVATISNDNLQDLKTGQLVGATPWKQQVALLFGVVFGSLVVPPVLQLMMTSFGFAGMPGAGPNALAAPQAALISALAKGVLGGDLNWAMIGWGALVGVGVVIVDELARHRQAVAAAAARRRARHLPANERHLARGAGRGDRLALRRLGRAQPRSRTGQAAGRADRDGHDRGREPVGGGVRRHRRGGGDGYAAGGGGGRVRDLGAGGRDGGVSGAGGVAVRADAGGGRVTDGHPHPSHRLRRLLSLSRWERGGRCAAPEGVRVS